MSRHRLRWPSALVTALAVTIATAGCTSVSAQGHHVAGQHATHRASASHPAGVSPSASPYAGAAGSGCGGTPVQQGHPPSWATGGFDRPIRVPYVLSAHKQVLAYLWAYPMTVHLPTTKADKILWFVQHRGFSPLHVHGHRLDAAKPVFSETITSGGGTTSADGTGAPSYVKVPASGCWHLALTWKDKHHSYHDTIDIRYVARQ